MHFFNTFYIIIMVEEPEEPMNQSRFVLQLIVASLVLLTVLPTFIAKYVLQVDIVPKHGKTTCKCYGSALHMVVVVVVVVVDVTISGCSILYNRLKQTRVIVNRTR